jgi:hypothetical protein
MHTLGSRPVGRCCGCNCCIVQPQPVPHSSTEALTPSAVQQLRRRMHVHSTTTDALAVALALIVTQTVIAVLHMLH